MEHLQKTDNTDSEIKFKMLMIIVDEQYRDNVEVVLEKHKVRGYSEIPVVLGEGSKGKRLGSKLHPGANSIVFSIVDSAKVKDIKSDLLSECSLNDKSECSNPIHIAIMNVEDFV